MRRSRFKLKPCALIAASVSLVFAPAPLWANPTGPSVVSGSAAFSNVGSTLTVTNSPNAIINWQGFSIGAGEATRFQQQSAASAVLNRVVGQDPSAILGTLWSNGRVFLVNPNGMLFGQGSRVDVAGLVASTLNITDSDFLGGRLNFQSGVIANSLVNQGELHSATGGHIYLIAPDVTNSGLITSPKGEVVLAAGKSVSLVDIGTPNLKVEISAPDTAARNLGQIVAESGRIGVYAGLINQSGVVRADSVSKDTTGKIVFRASDTTILDTGSVTSAAGAKGGEIQVLGNKVGLVGSALVDASGEAGGGTVLIGGDLQGKNLDIQNAWRTYVGPDATIKADAITSGDGGNVIVWSDDATRVYGSISARGGAQGGNGGFVETSGHYLEVTRAPDLSASQGKGGIWLLDPFDITIDVTSDQNISNVGSGSFFDYRGTASPSVVSVATILSALSGGGNVNVNTTGSGSGQGNITVNAAITTTQATAASLTLRADNNIQAAVDILLGSNVDLSLIASNNVAVANLGGKNVSVTASNGAITTGTVSAGSSLYMNADGAVQPGAITSGGYVQLQSYGGSVTVPNITTTGGSISVYSFDDLSLASTLSTPYGVTLQVAKPGGVLTMLAGSAVNGNTQGFGYSTSLSADDMVLGGAVNMGSNGYVYLNPYSNGRDVNIGAGTLAGALNLAPAELASITAGTLTVGSYYYGDLTVTSPISSTSLNATNLYLSGNNIALGASLGVSGSLSISASYNIDGNTTASPLDLTANQVSLAAYSGRIYRSGTGVTNINGVTNPTSNSTSYSLYAYLGSDLPGSVTASDVNISVPSGDYTLQTLNGNTVTLSVPAGAIIDGNGSTNNIIANTLNISAANGIGSGDAIETAVRVLNASSGGSGNIEITNIGNLTASITHSGTGGLALTNHGHLQVSAISVPAGNITIGADGRLTAPVAVSTTGALDLSGNGDVTTGNLSGSSVYLSSSGGAISTGTVSAGSSGVSMSARGALQPGAISSTGGVYLNSSGGAVTLSNITSTGSSIYIYSFDDLSLASTLSTPYGVTLQVAKPGGVLTMLSGSAINGNTQDFGYTTYLTADDMVLGGTVNNGSGGPVQLNPYSSGRDVNIGTGTLAGALNLAPAELATITAGTLTVGNYYYGDLTVASAIAPTDLNAASLQLYGNNITASAGIAVSGDLYLQANNRISTGNLSGDYVQVYAGGGGIATGTVSAGSSLYMYANGAVQPGDITAGGYVQLQSTGGSVTVPNITTTGSSIYIYSFDDVSLASTLNSPYGVTLQVAKPGGVLSMLSGSAVNGNTSGYGYSTSLSADDMVLGGTVNNGSNGYVYLNPYSSGRDVNIGTGTLAGALNLTPAELATITAGTLTVGNYYYGDLTVASALATTDIHATTLNLYGNNIALGAGIAVAGDLGIYANNNIDANTTSSTLDLFAFGNVDLIANNGQIFRSGTGVTNIAASTTYIYAPLGVDLGGTISSSDVDITWTSGDYAIGVLTGNSVTLNVTNGGVVDSNGSAVNITAGTLTINATNGIGHGDAIETQVSVLNASSGGSNNIEIANIGNLTVNSLSHTGTGNVILTNSGAMTLGGNVAAPAVRLSAGSSIVQSAGVISATSLTTASVGGTVLSASNAITTFNATNSGSGNIVLYSAAPTLEVTGISQSGGGSVALRANDLNISGLIDAGASLVSIAPYAANGDMFVGNVTGTGLQLSLAELQQINSTNVEFGRSDGTGNLAISLPATTTVAGTLRLLAGGSVNVSGGPYTLQGGTLQMPGTTNLQSGTSVIVQGGTFDASSGTVNVSGAFQASSGAILIGTMNILSGGTLSGGGTIAGNVNNSAGTVAPGASPGILTINGNYVQGPSGTLDMQIGGTTAGTEYDLLIVTGSASLDGTLNTTLINGFVPAAGSTFTLVQSGGALTGTFGSIVPPTGTTASTLYGPTTFELSAQTTSVPTVIEPVFNYTVAATQVTSESLLTVTEPVTVVESTTTEEQKLAKKPPACN
ncbi:MAG: filamentous hemagglutinin N-terminal domain-containing protein [Betaproteobacteria bacterium]|nr:filamentous hemagglutinin N-terminal domain-containing protein [Betaproteobacteria bacterium]